jgi:hypothetical protein
MHQHMEILSALTHDLSESGVRIKSWDFVPKGQKVDVELRASDFFWAGEAEVVWSSKDRFGDRYALGLRWIESQATDASLGALRQYCHRLRSQALQSSLNNLKSD